MQADEFEKKIQNKMEGFKLVPGAEVWKQVSIRIEKEKKKRRVLFYWMFLGFISIAGASIWLFINNENNRKPVIKEVNNNIAKGENYKIKPGVRNSPSSLNRGNKAETKKDIAYFRKGDIKYVLKSLTKNNNQTNITYSKVANNEANINKEKNNSNIQKQEKQILKPLPPHSFYNPNATATVDMGVKNKRIDRKTNLRKDTSAHTIAKEIIRTKGKINNKWNFGFTVYSGISTNLTGLPLLDKSYANYNYANNSPNSSSGNTGYYNYNIDASNNFKSGFSFGLGVFIKKPLTGKINLFAGIDYHLYSTVSKVGKRVNASTVIYDSINQTATSLDTYYNTGNSVSYSNKYHLVQLPINFELRLNKNPEKPITVLAGISPGYLVSSNALYANPSANVYYADKQKFQRFQFSAQTALSFPILSSPKYLLSAGLVAQYGFTNAAKAVTGSSQHLFFTGIKTNIIFK